jgi:DNA mismatch repair protein MutS
MREEYLKLYKEHSQKYGPNTCIFLEVGKFYEMYDKVNELTGLGETSMQKAVNILGIQLSLKDNNILFAGIPEQSLHKFASLLTREGWTVVVVDQEKNSSQKVVSRNVSQILSPGTHIESFSSDSVFIGSLVLESYGNNAPSFSISIADISTGRCYSYESKLEGKYDSWNFDRLLHFFQIHPVRELLVQYKGCSVTQEYLRQNLGLSNTLIHLKSYISFTSNEELMKKYFKNKSMISIYDFLKLTKHTLMEKSFIYLLDFLDCHFPSNKTQQSLESHTNWNPDLSTYLGNNVLNQLNFISTNNSILNYFQKTFTPMGKRGINERLLYPISDIDVLSMRVYKLENVMNMDVTKKKKIEHCLKQISDLQRIHHKFFSYNLNSVDILNLDQSYKRIVDIMKIYDNNISLIESFTTYYEYFKSQFDVEKAKGNESSDDTSFLNNTVAPKTYEVENNLKLQRLKAQSFLQQLIEFSGEKSLEFSEKETNIYSIDASRRIITNIDTKLKNTTHKRETWPHTNIEISLRKSNGSISSSYLEEIHKETLKYRGYLKENVKKELPPICNGISDNFKDLWLEIENYISDIDILFTLARVCKEKNFVKPIYEDNINGSGFKINGLRHPLIEEHNCKQEYVKHDVSLDKNGWLLYGMNASGKSSLMKAVGIAILLAQVGCYVPATSLTLKPYKSIYTRILNQDNIYAGLSSFAIEMLELREILKKADEYSLVLGDELCSGTESVSATALVAAGIIWLHNKKSSFIFATHYHGLNDITKIKDLENLKIYHLKVHYDAVKDLLVYDRNLEEGPGNTYYGLEVAKAMNIPHEYLELAQEIRKEILNEGTRTSPYNSKLLVKECEICGNRINSILEVHHITQQKEANKDGFLPDGTHKDSMNNLIVLCAKCHDEHHAGKLKIGKIKQTSEGEVREIEVMDEEKKKKSSKWKNEELEIIHSYLKKYTTLGLKRIMFDLEQNEDIKISEASLRSMRKELV